MTLPIIIGIIIVVLVLAVVGIYNNFISLKIKVDNAWSDIDVFLKKRYDLIPNLVETVKWYASHEQETLEKVINARSNYMSAWSADDKIAAEAGMAGALRQLFALSESYPDLKANTGFVQLQAQLEEIEDHIAQSRRYYNAVVRDYNTAVQVFPGNLVAGIMNFEERAMFQIDEAQKENIKVDFTK